MTAKSRRARFHYERRIFLLAMMAGLPGSAVALILLWTKIQDPKVQWTLTVLIVGCWLGFAGAVRERVVFPLRTLSNLLAALQEGDFSVRARGAGIDDALGEVMQQVNAMGGTLREQRLGALEATTLLRKVMEEIDVAIFAFDSQQLLRLVNRAGEKLLAKPAERLTGRSAEELDLAECLGGEPARILQTTFPSGPGRWGMRRSMFREHGLPMQLVVIGDLTRPLREEELQAWQRLVRVLGHELNNSLTPIKSIAGSLERLVLSDSLPPDWQEDMRRGLAVISARSESLSRFIGAYARLAKLPRPTLAPLDVAPWVRRVVGLETRLHVDVQAGPEIVIHGDADHRRGARDRRRRARGVAEKCILHRAQSGGRRTGPLQYRQSLRAVFHDQTRRLGNRTSAEPPDRRSPRRRADAREPPDRFGLRGAAEIAGVKIMQQVSRKPRGTLRYTL
jgi:PAS domain-containing protein